MQFDMKAQKEKEMSKFNPSTTLINPYARTGQKLARYADEAATWYTAHDHPELEHLFVLDFRYRTTEDFEKAEVGDSIRLRNAFLETGAYVSTEWSTRISVKLRDYLYKIKVKAERKKQKGRYTRRFQKNRLIWRIIDQEAR